MIVLDGINCHGEKASPVQQAAMDLAMKTLREAMNGPISNSGDEVLLTKLKRVPKLKRREFLKLAENSKLSSFTLEVLNFVVDYRGTNVKNFLNNLQAYMRHKIYDHGLKNRTGKVYQDTSIHSLIKKALIHTEL